MPALLKKMGWLLIGACLLSATHKKDHPFHVGVLEIEHNAASRSLELSCKLFIDDFENGLRTRFAVPVNLQQPAQQSAMDSLIARYLREHLSLSLNGKKIAGRYIGFEPDKEAVYAYVEYPDQPRPAWLQADCSILYETFKDQINIFHVTVEGKRQSSKLVHPAEQIEFRF